MHCFLVLSLISVYRIIAFAEFLEYFIFCKYRLCAYVSTVYAYVSTVYAITLSPWAYKQCYYTVHAD